MAVNNFEIEQIILHMSVFLQGVQNLVCPSSFPAMTLGLGLYMQDAIAVLSQTSLVLLVHPKHGPLAIFNSVVPLKLKKD